MNTVMCFGMEISLLSLLLLCCFESIVYTFLWLLKIFTFNVLVIINRKGLLHYTLLAWKTDMLALHSTPFWSGSLIRKAFKNKLYQLFCNLKNSIVQVKRTCRFCVICISYIDGKPIVKLQHRKTLLKDF